MDFHRLCPIHFPCHKMRDLTNCYSSMKLYRCKGDLFHQTSTPLINFNTAKPLFKLPEHRHIQSGLSHTVSIHSEYNKVMDWTKLVSLYKSLTLQSLYLNYQSTVIFIVDFCILCPINSEYNKVRDLTKLVCLY